MKAGTVYALLNKKIKGLTSGVQSATVTDTTITFTMNDGSTQTMTFPEPEDGVSVVSMDIDSNNHLICAMSDGTIMDAGEMPTVSGDVEQMIDDKIDDKLSNMDFASDADIEGLW